MHRWVSMVPLSVNHCVDKECWIRVKGDSQKNKAYFLPKGTTIVTNLWAAHHDTAKWGPDAHQFRPERFLNEHGEYNRIPGVMPFSFGARSCPGEVMADAEIFIFFSFIIQRYHIRPDAGLSDPVPSKLWKDIRHDQLEGVYYLVYAPVQQSVHFERR